MHSILACIYWLALTEAQGTGKTADERMLVLRCLYEWVETEKEMLVERSIFVMLPLFRLVLVPSICTVEDKYRGWMPTEPVTWLRIERGRAVAYYY